MNYINRELNIIKQNSIKKRLERELEALVNLRKILPESVKINVEYNKSLYNIENYSVEFINIIDNKYYKFIIDHNYPFRPPKLEINFRPYIYYLNIKSIGFQANLLKYNKIRCFCCETILCGNNWHPVYTMSKVMYEVESFKNISRDISYNIIIDVIKRKYLIDDINISQWLFK